MFVLNLRYLASKQDIIVRVNIEIVEQSANRIVVQHQRALMKRPHCHRQEYAICTIQQGYQCLLLIKSLCWLLIKRWAAFKLQFIFIHLFMKQVKYIKIMKHVKKIISEKIYREEAFNSDYEKMSYLFRLINEMQINEELFKVIRILIRYFRFPSLILFKPIYREIEHNQEKYLQDARQDLLKTAAYAKAIIKERIICSLDFYFKAGCDNSAPQALSKEDYDSSFIGFVQSLEERMSMPASSLAAESRMLGEIEVIIQENCKKRLVIERLCLEAFLNTVKQRKAQIDKLQQLQQRPVQKSLAFQSNNKIRIQQGKDEMIIKDPQAAGLDLCCRPYFYMNEIIDQPQSLVQEYKNYSYPYDQYCSEILTKTICGFLNGKGGIIYIGIKEDTGTKKRIIWGDKYSESIKEKLLTYFRIRCQKISPEIVNQQFYKIQYVPIKDPNRSNAWMPGMFIIRLKVQRGNKNDLYSYRREDGEQFLAFRTQNEVLVKRIGQEILELYRQRLTSDDTNDQSYLSHQGPCRPVQIGKQVFEYDNIQINPWDKKPYSQANNKPLFTKSQGKFDFKLD